MGLIKFSEDIAKKLEPAFKRINGGYFGIVGTIACVIFIGISATLYSVLEPITIFTH